MRRPPALPVTVTGPSPYAQTVVSDGASLYWPLDDNGSSAVSVTGPSGTYGSGITKRVAGAPVAGIESAAIRTNGTSNGIVVANETATNPGPYSTEVWFRTSSTSGGKIVGFGNAASGSSSNYDRHVIMLNDGRLMYGVWLGFTATVTSPASYNDGAWHHLVATLGAGGLQLYVDGQGVAGDPGVTSAQSYTGRWRIGGDTTWGGASSDWISGDLDEFAVYPTQLSAAQVAHHYDLAGATVDTTPPSAATGLTATLDSGDVDLTWTAATDASGVASYRVHRLDSASATPSAGTQIGTVTGTSFTDADVPDGHWWYRVVAVDTPGNVGPASALRRRGRQHAARPGGHDAVADGRRMDRRLGADDQPGQRLGAVLGRHAGAAGLPRVHAAGGAGRDDPRLGGAQDPHDRQLDRRLGERPDRLAQRRHGVDRARTDRPEQARTRGDAGYAARGDSGRARRTTSCSSRRCSWSGLGGPVTLVISTAGGDALQVVSDEDPNTSRRPQLVLTYQ